MSEKKEHTDLYNDDCNINSVYDFFENEGIKSDLYNFLGINAFLEAMVKKYIDESLDSDAQSDIEKLSHYYITKLLYEKKIVDHVEEFASSKKTLKSCFKGNFDDIELLWLSLIPVMFSSIKEHFMGGNSWQDHLDRFGEEDFSKLLADVKNWLVSDKITLLKPSHLSSKQFISEIRNAFEHTRYLFGLDALYIKNPKSSFHKCDFEAKIPYTFLLLLVLDISNFKPKNSLGIYLQCDDEIYSNPNGVEYGDFKNKFHIYQYLAKGKNDDDAITKKREISKSKYLLGDVGEVVEYSDGNDTHYGVLSEGGLLTNYFSKEKFDIKRLNYIASALEGSLIVPMSQLVYCLLIKDNHYKGLKSMELLDDAYKYFGFMFTDPLGNYCASEQEMSDILKNYHLNKKLHNTEVHDDEKNEILGKLVALLQNAKQSSNGQSLLKTFGGCRKYSYDYLIRCGFEYDGKIFKKGSIEITEKELSSLLGHLTEVYFLVGGIVDSFPNRLKVQMIKMVYLNELISLEKNNADNRKSENEHIRNALAHDNYIILAGVDQILLRDGYSRSSDKWNWERLYNLSELYENTFKAMDVYMKNMKLNNDWRIKNVND